MGGWIPLLYLHSRCDLTLAYPPPLIQLAPVTTTVNVLVVAVGDFQQTVFIYRALTTLCSTRLLLHVRRVADSKSGKALLEGRSSEEDVGKVAIKPRSTRPNRSTRADDQGSRTSQKELLSNSSRGSAVDYEKV
jgi:hypothetical protein